MRDFDYLLPRTISEASGLLAEHGEGSRLIGGGTALLLALRQRMIAPSQLISLARIRALRGITYNDKTGLRIGAMTPHAEVASSLLVREHYPMLADMASRLANPQVRNQGTIGGNICYGDPATDPPTCLMALDASLVLSSTRGERIVPVAAFLIDYYTTDLAPPATFDLGYHVRFHRTAAEHRPLVNMAVTLKRNENLVRETRLVVGAATIVPTRVRAAETFLEGKAMTIDVAREVADIVAAGIEPISDIRGVGAYRRDMVRVVARRTIERLFGLQTTAEMIA